MSGRRLLGAMFLSLSISACIAEPIPPPSPSPSPSDVISVATTLPSAADGSASTTISVPRASVSEAVAIRDAGVDRRELDVAGFLSRTPVLACPVVLGDQNPTRLDCPQNFQWLMAKPEELEHQTADGFSLGPPTGPAIRPSFAFVDQPQPLEWRVGADEPAPAAPVEVIGHFDDRRAALCGRDRDPQLRCADTFMVDQVVAVDGQPVGVATSEDLVGADGNRMQPVSAIDDIDLLVARADPGVAILSRRVVLAGRLKAIEPGIQAGSFDSPIVWSVVGLDPSAGPPAEARTFLVPDGGSEAIALPNDEPGSTAPQPAPS
jgi:hypothetical protein